MGSHYIGLLKSLRSLGISGRLQARLGERIASLSYTGSFWPSARFEHPPLSGTSTPGRARRIRSFLTKAGFWPSARLGTLLHLRCVLRRGLGSKRSP